MPLLDIGGTTVNFPYTPYDCQLAYLEKVLQCLKTVIIYSENSNGILESPTGTGKTLCLLCSTLAWLQDRKAQTELNRQANLASLVVDGGTLNKQQLDSLSRNIQQSTGVTWGGSEFVVPKIIYASRTHSQLSQAVQELKRTAYNNMKVSVIGSRDQLCIHEQVRKEKNNSNKIHMCRAKVAARTCHYYNRYEDIKRNSEIRSLMGDVVDIEDIVTYGEKQRVCPYYMTRELKSDADIIFMPYNYLLDPKMRMNQGIEIQGNVLIFDEAHNLERICEDSSSFELTPGDLATAMEELTKLAQKMLEMAKNEDQSLVEDTESGSMPGTLVDLEKEIDEIEVLNTDKGLTKPGVFIFELFNKVHIGFESKNYLIDLFEKMISFVSTDAAGVTVLSKGSGLTKIVDVIKVHIQPAPQNNQKKKMDTWTTSSKPTKSGKTLCYWCFSPGHRMLDLVSCGVKCIILTSGTLSPLKSFTAEMQIEFPITLENPHVIEKHQIFVGSMGKGPDNTVLNSNYETRYGKVLRLNINFSRIVPKGLLIFFPSYPVMEKCIENWQSNGIYNSISQYKAIYVEPRGKGLLDDVMDEFYDKINNPALNGAIFAAVCRGKVSEGLDFSDDNGRAVIITGLPYPPRMDPKVNLKMQFLDEMRNKNKFKSLTGQEWYRQQASRAVNQAIGRVIRHRQDFGAILLCDTRFSAASAVSQLPLWVKPHVKNYDMFGKIIKDVIVFFKTTELKVSL
ncbi:hypothetical protein FSP39_023453 [Pinctada imbricata]|uniref:Regulator of telomere elongation helicase 1 homolog n=1 Tax=Pinctada imbricata TaxID=66713 RepID=A0AA89BRZ5_PINIB|nr:hypothetical protein FSP39_023453 [Pinctada imbricata]